MLETIRSVALMELDDPATLLLAQRLEDWLIEVMEIPDGRWVDHGWATMEVDNLRVAIRTAIDRSLDEGIRAPDGHVDVWLFTAEQKKASGCGRSSSPRGNCCHRRSSRECIAIAAENARFMVKRSAPWNCRDGRLR